MRRRKPGRIWNDREWKKWGRGGVVTSEGRIWGRKRKGKERTDEGVEKRDGNGKRDEKERVEKVER